MAVFDISGNKVVASGLIDPDDTSFMTVDRKVEKNRFVDLIPAGGFVDVTRDQNQQGVPYGYITGSALSFTPGEYWFYSIYKTVSGVIPKFYDGATLAPLSVSVAPGESGFWDGNYNEYHKKHYKTYRPNENGYMVAYKITVTEPFTGFMHLGAGGQCFVMSEPGYTYLFQEFYNPHLDTLSDVVTEELFVAEKYAKEFVSGVYKRTQSKDITGALPILAKPISSGKYWYHIGDSNSDWFGGKVLDDASDAGFLLTAARKNGVSALKNTGHAGASWGLRDNDTDGYSGVQRVDDLVASGEKPDIITILLGTNSDLSAGTVDDPPTDKHTTCSAVKYCLETLLSAFPHAALGVMLPMQRAETYMYQEQTNALIKELAEYYSVPVLDLFHAGHIVPDSKLTSYDDGHTGVLYVDSAHITPANGQIQLGRIISGWINLI